MELTNNIIKLVSSLSQKKNRVEHGIFAAEGTKCVRDTWGFFKCKWIIATQRWYEENGVAEHLDKIMFANKRQMERMSQFSTPAEVIAIYELPKIELDKDEIKNSLSIVLDNIQDPGNLGTIIRIADWYGIKNIICSKNTVDAYSHKVIQATMGAISRVKVHYFDLNKFLAEDFKIPIYGTFLKGDNIYKCDLSNTGFIIFGNEGSGISPAVTNLVTQKLFLPPFPANAKTSESLNVGMATAITIGEFRRRFLMSE